MGKENGCDGVDLRVSTPIPTPQEVCCSFENLYKAMLICKQNVMWKDSTAGFVKNGLRNCHQLHDELMNGTYKLCDYSVFEIHEKKTRIIVSTRMRDRVVQRSLCDNYLYEQLTKGFIYDNCACLKNKGTDFARDRLKCHLQRYFRKHGLDGYVLKVDIKDFFGSTLHSVAKDAVAKRVPDEWARSMVFSVIDSFQHLAPDRGMGLGSQITQLTQLAVLDDLDHEIKEQMRIKGYVRYMDDLILIHESREYLEECLMKIEAHLNGISLCLNRDKTNIQPIRHGINFLGFSFRLTETGKVVMKLQSGKVGKARRRFKKISKIDQATLEDSYQSWRSFVGKGDCHRLLSEMDGHIRTLKHD